MTQHRKMPSTATSSTASGDTPLHAVGPASFSTAYGTMWEHKEGASTTARLRPTLTTHMNSLVSLTLHMQGKEETSRTNFPALSIGSLILYSL